MSENIDAYGGNDSSDAGVSRRKWLHSVGGGALVFTTHGVLDTRSDDAKKIITAANRGEAVRTEVVPNEWYEKIIDSRRARDRLVDELYSHDDVGEITITTEDEKIEGLAIPKIEIGLLKDGEVPDPIPSRVEGIKIETTTHRPPQTECNSQAYDCVPGGCRVDTEGQDGDFFWHSGACAVDYNLNEHFITCAHGMGDCGDGDLSGHEVRVGEDSSAKKIGTVQEHSWAGDWAVCNVSSDNEIDGLANEVLGGNSIAAHVTENGIDYLMSNSSTVHKYGDATCQTSGTVDGKPTYTYCNSSREWVRTTANSQGGDSGGVHFVNYDNAGETDIIGVHHGSTSNAWASPAYTIVNNTSIDFGIGSNTC